MTAADFGILNTLLSLSVIVSIPCGAITFLSAKYVAVYAAHNEFSKARKFWGTLLRYALLLGVVSFILLSFLSEFISKLLQIEQPFLIILVAFSVAFTCVSPVFSGTLQGLKRFLPYSMITIIATAVKLICSLIAMVIGWGLTGVVGLLFLNVLIPIFYGGWVLRDFLRQKPEPDTHLERAGIAQYFTGAFWIQMLILFIGNADMVFVKMFAISDTEAGIYSSGMVVGKMAMYVATAVAAAVFPMVAEEHAKGRDTRRLFFKALLYGGGASLLASLALNVFGDFVIQILFGERYMGVVPLLLPISVLIMAIVCITILTNYLMALGRMRQFAIILGVGCGVIVLLVNLFHQTISQILYSMASVLFVVFLVSFFITIQANKASPTQKGKL